MAEWASGTVQANGITIHYIRTGGAKPPLVLAHGMSDNGLCWTPVARVFESQFDVIMPDARGHGRSDAPERGYESADHAADLHGLIAALGLERPALLGHSMGAATSIVLAGTYPDLTRCVVLEDPPARWMVDPAVPVIDEARRNRWRDWLTSYQTQTREELIAKQRAESGWPEDELGPWADAKLQVRLAAAGAGDGPPLDWTKVVRQITCPILLVTGDPAQGALVSPEDAAVFEQLVPRTRIAYIAGAGHNIRREKRQEYLDVVGGFLREFAT